MAHATAPIILTSFGAGVVPPGEGRGNLVEDAAGDLFGVTVDWLVFEVKKTGAGYSAPVDLVPFPAGTPMGNIAIDATTNFGTTLAASTVPSTVFEIEKTATGYAIPTTLAVLPRELSKFRVVDQRLEG